MNDCCLYILICYLPSLLCFQRQTIEDGERDSSRCCVTMLLGLRQHYSLHYSGVHTWTGANTLLWILSSHLTTDWPLTKSSQLELYMTQPLLSPGQCFTDLQKVMRNTEIPQNESGSTKTFAMCKNVCRYYRLKYPQSDFFGNCKTYLRRCLCDK